MRLLLLTLLFLSSGATLAINPDKLVSTELFTKTGETLLLGTWQNDSQGNRVGLDLRPEGECSLSIDRALGNRSDRKCTYEPFEDRYLIFLISDQGLCDGNADFEFIFNPDLPLITLIVGNAQIYMNRLQD